MSSHTSRRTFLRQTAAWSAVAGLADLSFLARLSPVAAADAVPHPEIVRFDDGVESLVRLLEETPRAELLEVVAKRVGDGLAYRDLLAALLLAGIRNVQPRPDVGFKFHAVLVVNSAHLASMASPEQHRWLPIFWSLDYFKQAQSENTRQGNWRMTAVDESKVPSASRARAAFSEAMDQWNVPAADAAATRLARSVGVGEVFEHLYRYGARDFRDIGHKAIYVANARRTLECIGYHHAEPIVRSLSYALLAHEGSRPDQRDDKADRPWRKNVERAARIRPDWQDGKLDTDATVDLLAALRQADEDQASEKVVELLNRGVGGQTIWDGLLLAAGELLARQPGIVPLHAVTTTNALRYAYNASGSDDTRKMLLLQNAAFLTMFRQAMGARMRDCQLDQLPTAPLAKADARPIEEIFADVSADKIQASGKLLTYLQSHPDPREFIDHARLLIFLKGTNAHDYKFSSAALEDYQNVSPRWRANYLASSVFNLKGSGARDNALVQRIRTALG